MFGTYVRAAYAFVVTALFAGVITFVYTYFEPILQAGADDAPEAAQGARIIGFFDSTATWFVLVGLLSIAVLVVGRAVYENRIGGGY
jgi:hypothetical protein